MQLMSLGMFVFGLPTLAFDDFQRKASWRHATHARVGARDAAQFVGIGEESVSIAGTAYAELSDGDASIDELREMADTGEHWPLLDGAGRIYGAFVILTIDEKRRRVFTDGRPRAIDFAIELLRVDEDVE